MGASFQIVENIVTVHFSYSADVSRMVETVKSAVKYMHHNGKIDTQLEIPLDELTDQQFLDILDQWFLQSVISMAKEQLRSDMLSDILLQAETTVGDEIEAKFL